jgi:hypothetical protein
MDISVANNIFAAKKAADLFSSFLDTKTVSKTHPNFRGITETRFFLMKSYEKMATCPVTKGLIMKMIVIMQQEL